MKYVQTFLYWLHRRPGSTCAFTHSPVTEGCRRIPAFQRAPIDPAYYE